MPISKNPNRSQSYKEGACSSLRLTISDLEWMLEEGELPSHRPGTLRHKAYRLILQVVQQETTVAVKEAVEAALAEERRRIVDFVNDEIQVVSPITNRKLTSKAPRTRQ